MDLINAALPAFLLGAENTIIYCISSFALALLFGLILALMNSSQFAWLKTPARIFIEVIRSTPIITQLFLLYYGVGAVLVNFNLAYIDNAWTAGIATLSLNYAAYEAEVYRAGAAHSLGLTQGQTFFRIVLPQAIPLMIPPFVNDFIYMLKDSAIVSVISGTEITSQLNFWVSRHGSNPLPLFALAIVLYLILSLPTSYFARRYESRLRAAL